MPQPPAPIQLCAIDRLAEGASAAFTLGDSEWALEIMLVRHQGRFHAYANRCPHTGGPLDWVPGRFLDLQGRWIQCATHDALFRIEDGFCVHGPCVGQSLVPVPVRTEAGAVWVETAALAGDAQRK